MSEALPNRSVTGEAARPVAITNAKVYSVPATGQIRIPSASTEQGPDVACDLVKIKARYNNQARVYVGTGPAVTAAQDPNTDNIHAGLELSPGEETGWIPIDNLDRFWFRAVTAGDGVTYLAMVS